MKQPNPTKFKHNKRFLFAFKHSKIIGENRLANNSIRHPGETLVSCDGVTKYEVQLNGSLRKII